MTCPKKISHWLSGREIIPAVRQFFPKYNPATGKILAQVVRGRSEDVEVAVKQAAKAYERWSQTPVMARALILQRAARLVQEKADEAAGLIALESGKPKKAAAAGVASAVECGLFFAGEGRRFYGQTITSGVPNRRVWLERQSIGVGALFTPLNTPLSTVAAKTFPALLCGNAVILKAHEDVPFVPVWFGKILREAGLPAGVFNVVQGLGKEAGAALASHPEIKFISFTGSSAVASSIIKASAGRLAKVSIESGGKNPLLVCDDADLEKAAEMAVSAAFIGAGQRCTAASRIIVMGKVYEKFKKIFLKKVESLQVGIGDDDDYGAIINEPRLNEILRQVRLAKGRGAKLAAGGFRLKDKEHASGYFMAPTVLENVKPSDPLSQIELFGPVTILYKARDFAGALKLANNSQYKLSGAIQTRSFSRAAEFINKYQAGVVRVNGPTFGSEPHMPFGGLGLSGNGWREGGTQALDFYSEWKQVSIDY